MEKWLPIDGFEGLYEISNLGRVKTFHRSNRPLLEPGIKQSGKTTTNGYACAHLTKNGVHKTFTVHRIVANAFIPNPENKPEINHIDGNKHNNCVENLEWVTCSENKLHASKTGLRIHGKGEKATGAKLTEANVLKIRELAGQFTRKNIARMFSVAETTVDAIVRRENWKHI